MKLAAKKYGCVLIYFLFSLFFHRLFYQQSLGINLILTEAILIGGLFLFSPIDIRNLQPFLAGAYLLSLYGALIVYKSVPLSS
ncbi:MAG: hypothetical protein GC180_08895 [Bacteroidetes bacterium]|nr:hypothetical protein [Bacteroidota bacterium]